MNAGGVADEDAEFKEYPITADKQKLFKYFGGHVNKMLDDIKEKSGVKVLVRGLLFACDALCVCRLICVVLKLSKEERAKITPEFAILSSSMLKGVRWIRIVGECAP